MPEVRTYPIYRQDEESAAWNPKSVESNSVTIHVVSTMTRCWIAC